MRCAAYITAESYDLNKLDVLAHELIQDLGSETSRATDALCLSVGKGYAFFFSYGCIVFWNLELKQESEIIEHVRRVSSNPVEQSSEEFEYKLGKKQKVLHDSIVVSNEDDIVQQMLSVSYGLSQSMMLSMFEERIIKKIDDTRYIPEEMSKTGKIPLSRKQIAKEIGALFMERSWVNLHTDILDTPSYFWDHPEYEDLYTMTIKDQDLHARTSVLNTRLDIIRELFEVLNDAMNTRHSSILEWIIIWLIFSEVLLTIFLHYR